MALTAWIDPDDHTLLASGGADGVILVWDTTTRRLLSRRLVEPIRLRGLADRPARDDLLGRAALTQVLANLLLWRPAQPGGETGPGVVTIEGPWGTGKTTIMQLVESRITTKPENKTSNSQLSVAAAHKILRRGRITGSLASRIIGRVRSGIIGRVRSKIAAGVRSKITGGLPPGSTGAPRSGITRPEYRGALTAWFNAWVSQSSEQVWAGLARSIALAAKPVLYPDEAGAQADAYWLARNVPYVDRFVIIRSLLLRILSPLLGFSAVIAVATVLINLAMLNGNTLLRIDHWRITPSALALVIAAAFLLAGITQTIMRYYGPAGPFLPPDVVRGPVLSGSFGEDAPEAAKLLRDPVYLAKSGYLSIVQADAAKTVRDLHTAGYDLVIFVDDLDRCSARTTAEVFEALNLFLSDTNLEVKFVIGLDPAVAAARLDDIYKDLDNSHLVQYGDDPSAGWAFLRKVVQLPVGAPRITDMAIDQFLGAAFDVPPEEVRATAGTLDASSPASEDRKTADPAQSAPAILDHSHDVSGMTGEEPRMTDSLERQPQVLALMRQRLAAQPERSARETKRLLNVWQLYQRVLDLVAPLHDDEEIVERACHLIILAEIITRWPALQRQLNQSWNERRALKILATACRNDDDWTDALKVTKLDKKQYVRAIANLRSLLLAYDAIEEVADLAAKVL